MKEYENRIQKIFEKVQFAEQTEQKGFGHAVYQASTFARNEPVLLLLGDTIYKSGNGVPCTKQVIDAYEKYGKPIVALQTINTEEVSSFGIFTGKWDDSSQRVLNCSRVVEKPNPDYAKEYLAINRKGLSDICCAAFGTYVLTKEIFERLGYAIKNNMYNNKGEIDLTDAFASAIKEQNLLGYLVDGESFDLGNADAYLHTVSNYRNR